MPFSDAERAFAIVARRSGTRTLPTATWGHVMSLELGWMPPGDAARLVAAAHAAGVLVPGGSGDALHFVHDPAAVDVPPGFRPTPTTADNVPPPALPKHDEPPGPAPSATDLATRTATTAPPTPPTPPTTYRYDAWLAYAAAATGRAPADIGAAIRERQARFDGRLSTDAALLWWAADQGVPGARQAASALTSIATTESATTGTPPS